MSKKSLLIAVVLFFLLIASAMALENKSASENFTSSEYLNAKTIDAPNAEAADFADEEGYSLQTDPDRWTRMFSALQPYSGQVG